MSIKSLLFLFIGFYTYGFILREDSVELIKALKTCQNLSSIKLPAFLEAPNSPMFSLYFWTQKPLNPALPTLALIPGGPGQTYHNLEWAQIEDINILYFDPRGMGCSTPLNNNLINNPEFYSAKRAAQDLEQLRKYLKISKWSVYGHSYGTITASIYASLFPDKTDILLLEGTVLQGGKEFWYSEARLRLLQTILQLTPKDFQDKILSASEKNLHSLWFSQTLLDSLPQGFNQDSFEKRLAQNFKTQQKSPIKAVIHDLEDLTPYFSRNAHLILSCKELAADKFSPKRLFNFEGTHFEFLTEPTYKQLCTEWDIRHDIYDSKNYPITSTTFYFQGEYDYLTPEDEALEHYKNNQSKQKNFYSLKAGGHNPFSLSLNEFNKATTLSALFRSTLSDILYHKFNFIDFKNSSKKWNQEWDLK